MDDISSSTPASGCAPGPGPRGPADRPTDAPTVVSRRRFVAIAGGALGVAGLGLLRQHAAAAEIGVAALDEPGSALQPARRVVPTTTDPNATTIPATTDPDVTADPTETTVPPTSSTVPVPDGQIRFPILVEEDDDCYVLDNFGDCRGSGCSRSHEGVDIMADQGLAVIAPVAGRLEKRYDDSGLLYGAGNGWTLVDEDESAYYRFFHLDRHEDGLEVDDEVEAGQVIGYVGNTGTSGADGDFNYHLHFEYRPGNEAEDSYPTLQRVEHVIWETD